MKIQLNIWSAKSYRKNFIKITEGKKDDVVSMSSSVYVGKIERNRGILKSILKVIVLCGRQNIALRSHTEEKKQFYGSCKFFGQKPISF